MRFLKPDEDPLPPQVAARRKAFKDWVYPYVLLQARKYQNGRLQDPEDVAARTFTHLYWQWDAKPELFEIGGSRTLLLRAVLEECRKALTSEEKRDRRQGRHTQERGVQAAPTGAEESDGSLCLEVVGGTLADEPFDEEEGLWVCHLFMLTVPEQSRRMLILAREEEMESKAIASLMGVSQKTVKRHVDKWGEELDRVMVRYMNGEPVIEELKAKLPKEDT